jgi:hypothetical protein
MKLWIRHFYYNLIYILKEAKKYIWGLIFRLKLDFHIIIIKYKQKLIIYYFILFKKVIIHQTFFFIIIIFYFFFIFEITSLSIFFICYKI